MPWKECNIVEERLRFIARLLDGEKMSGSSPVLTQGTYFWRRPGGDPEITRPPGQKSNISRDRFVARLPRSTANELV